MAQRRDNHDSEQSHRANGARQDQDVERRVERALLPYAGVLAPDDLSLMRDTLRLYVGSHPDVALLLSQLRYRAPMAESGEVPTTDVAHGQPNGSQEKTG